MADDTYSIQKAAELVQRSYRENTELAAGLRTHAEILIEHGYPHLAKQIIAVAKALEKAAAAAGNFSARDALGCCETELS